MTSSINRRTFVRTAVQSLAVAPLAARAWQAGAQSPSGHILFVGTQTKETSKGIYAYQWDAGAGTLKETGLAAWADYPTFLAFSPDHRYLYAANEIDNFGGAKSGGVSAFSVEGDSGRLKFLNAVPAAGDGTCHVATDHTGRAVFCANYGSGSAASFKVQADGSLSMPVSHFQYSGHGPDKSRQEGPHAHRVTVSPDNRYLFVNDLGLDCIHIYRLDAATAVLTPSNPPLWKSEPGAGPRALRFHPNGKFAYCIEEMACALAVLSWDPKAGKLTEIQKVSIKTDGFTGATLTGCEVVLTRDGKFAYAANRGDDQIVSFTVDPDTGKVTFLDRIACGGKIPRHITLDPTEGWLLVANQTSDNISVLRRDAQTGKLSASSNSYPLTKPQCLVFL
jgi:6-phosphogluconolactonase